MTCACTPGRPHFDGIRLDVVLCMEDMMDRGQAGVLVDAVVARDVMRGEEGGVVFTVRSGDYRRVAILPGLDRRQRNAHLVHRARGVAHVGDDGVAGLLDAAVGPAPNGSLSSSCVLVRVAICPNVSEQ